MSKRIANVFFDALANAGTSRFSIRLVNDGKDVHPAEFLTARTGDGLIDHVTVNDRVLHHYLQQGATVVFDHVNDHIPYAQAIQAIQDHIEAITGARCWVQCYITQASSSAFSLHRDDHTFIIVQLFGRKEWRHASETVEAPDSSVYEPGTVTFYPKGTPHDVHGIGELSMHLTIAFEGHQGKRINEVSDNLLLPSDVRRRGSGLPYSLSANLITSETAARLSISHIPDVDGDLDVLQVWTGTSKLAVPTRYSEVLQYLARSSSTTPAEVSARFELELDDVMRFWSFGFEQGLLLTPVM